MTSIPLSYGPAEILKVTVTFNYDRYVIDRSLTNKEIFSRTFEYNLDPERRIYSGELDLDVDLGSEGFIFPLGQ